MIPDRLVVRSVHWCCLPAAAHVSPRKPNIPRQRQSLIAEANLRVDTALAVIPVHVTNILGTPINGLGKDNFRLFENGVEQSISYFATEDAPLSLGLLFDSSGSMQNKMTKSLEAAAELFKTS